MIACRIASCTLPVAVMLVLASVCFGSEPSAANGADARSGPSGEPVVRPLDLAAVRRSFDALARDRAAMTEREWVAAWADFSRLASAVIGNSPVGSFTFDDLVGAAGGASGPEVAATRGVTGRNRVAYDMLAVGYSARETADVVGGRISLRALVTARRMIAIGLGRDKAADYLDRQYRCTAAEQERLGGRSGGRSGSFDALIQRYANAHDVEPAIVHAVIAAESAFDPAARSRAGAIGLMQLMPLTARELQVDPLVPEQNIEGGVRYLSQLLERFGELELALVAYNAGPAFAERYVRGQAVLHEETRAYVNTVLASLNDRD